ncbi:ribose 5-phosphate isomerase B [Stella sp.]|uniref:ribose 5-phosphate isomerase B n=1 Tax=Stella sp. TaxID=2912054 RepID=UPI0035B36245
MSAAPQTPEVIALASDHAGAQLKAILAAELERLGFQPLDLGTAPGAPVDYPDMAEHLAATLATGTCRRGVLVCGSGIGISIAANRHRHVRAALCHDVTGARLCREHNDANVLVLGERTTGAEVARDCLATFLSTDFAGGRHGPRVAKLG